MTTKEMTFAPAAVGTIGQDRAVATLTAAFCADPVIRWVFPQPRACLRACPELANLVAGDAFAAGTAEVAPGYARVAMWLGPDAPSDDDASARCRSRRSTRPEPRRCSRCSPR